MREQGWGGGRVPTVTQAVTFALGVPAPAEPAERQETAAARTSHPSPECHTTARAQDPTHGLSPSLQLDATGSPSPVLPLSPQQASEPIEQMRKPSLPGAEHRHLTQSHISWPSLGSSHCARRPWSLPSRSLRHREAEEPCVPGVGKQGGPCRLPSEKPAFSRELICING